MHLYWEVLPLMLQSCTIAMIDNIIELISCLSEQTVHHCKLYNQHHNICHNKSMQLCSHPWQRSKLTMHWNYAGSGWCVWPNPSKLFFGATPNPFVLNNKIYLNQSLSVRYPIAYNKWLSHTYPQDHLSLKTICVKRPPLQTPKSALHAVTHLC